jgi:hypothetical protein
MRRKIGREWEAWEDASCVEQRINLSIRQLRLLGDRFYLAGNSGIF